MKIGVFGGSFDPVHVGHLIVAECAADSLELDSVLFIPARVQPFKVGLHSADASHRVAMLRLAIAGNSKFSLDEREIAREGPSYTSETLRELCSENPADELFLLVGADAALDLPLWHDAEMLAQYARIAVLTRPGFEVPDSRMISESVEVPAIAVSASLVRQLASAGRSLRYLLPAPVLEYIETNGLYGLAKKC